MDKKNTKNAEKLKKWRRGRGLTQKELALELGFYGASTVSRWEAGTNEVPQFVLRTIEQPDRLELDLDILEQVHAYALNHKIQFRQAISDLIRAGIANDKQG